MISYSYMFLLPYKVTEQRCPRKNPDSLVSYSSVLFKYVFQKAVSAKSIVGEHETSVILLIWTCDIITLVGKRGHVLYIASPFPIFQ